MGENSQEIKLRKASVNDLSMLQYWDEKPHTINSDPNDDWHWEIELQRNPDWRELFIAELNGRPIGFMQIIDPACEETNYWGKYSPNLRAIDIWIGEEYDLGKGYGTIMMKLALQHCFTDRTVTAVLLDPLETNKRAHTFYERLGFKFVEKRIFGEDSCFVYRLDRDDWEKRKRW
jgi:aminoglycoside 6'-N-acetyltransferase